MSPVLTVHGNHDLISPPSRGQRIAELTGGDYVELDGAGHIPLARDPVRINLLIRDFALQFRAHRTAPGLGRPPASKDVAPSQSFAPRPHRIDSY